MEQELQLSKKQYDVYMKLKDSELQNQKTTLDKQILAIKTQEQRAADERVRQAIADYEQQIGQQQEELRGQIQKQEKDAQQQVAKLTQTVTQLQTERTNLVEQLEQATQLVGDLEAQVDSANAAAAAAASSSGTTEDNLSSTGLAEEEKRIYVEQIELLQQQVKELEQEKFAKVQEDMDSGLLASPKASAIPYGMFGATEEEVLAAREKEIEDKNAAAERTLAMAEAIKQEAQDLVAKSQSNGGGGSDEDRSARLVGLFKESVNDMFFRFQDFFEEEQAIDGKQVLSVIRKVLKQSTKEVIQRLEEPATEPEAAVVEEATAEAVAEPVVEAVVSKAVARVIEEEDPGNESDGPPAPPPNTNPEIVSSSPSVLIDEAHLASAVEAAPTPSPVVVQAAPALKTPQYPSSDEEEDESEDEFNT